MYKSMNLKDSVQFEFGSVIGLLKREMESGPITNLYLNLIRSKQLARECKQTACEPSLSSIFGGIIGILVFGLDFGTLDFGLGLDNFSLRLSFEVDMFIVWKEREL